MRPRHQIEVEKSDRVSARVVLSAHEPRVAGNLNASGRQHFADGGRIQKRRQRAAIRPALASRTGAAIVSRLVGVVEAKRAMAKEQHQPRESRRQADVAEQAFAERRHFLQREADMIALRAGIRRLPFQPQPGHRGRLEQRASRSPDQCRPPGKQHAKHERHRRQHAEGCGEQQAARRAAGADMELMRCRADHPPRLRAPPIDLPERVDHVLRHPVLRTHHDGTQR